ncbi:Low-molecular weight cobalt-containing nitrile hydratase subunit alpha [Streptomyces sp. RB5]|uniref:nitrile hydratase n=1 Tax=Streptomyces smaragdinus TaxID=2585196 RepID=A0A7K0CJ44_9ACTN|nr:nitrile hydratase subunit alpha [Streptomyces smaragdinus]MQY13505.1 Low-molecular weight cobalt-containing nitrile hydratase subunit alpha [Streptomyces smaragdinus]
MTADPHAPIETAAAEPDYFDVLQQAIRELLVEKGLIEADEVRAMIETLDAHQPALGSALVARAWTDEAFKERLLADGTAAIEEFGIENYDGTKLIVLEQTPEEHNLVVCTLCSCYPRPVLGLPPDWYKSRPYRARAVREPRVLLKEFGTDVPEDVTIRVHDSNANMRYLVLPMRPAGTDGMTERELAGLVTRDTMIGVTTPRLP